MNSLIDKLNYRIHETHNDVVLIPFSGVFSSEDVGTVKTVFSEIFNKDIPFLIIELHKTEHLSGAVVGEIMEWKKKFGEKFGGDICFAGASSMLQKELGKLGSEKLFRFFSDEAGALNYLSWEYKGHIESIIIKIPPNLKVVPMTRKMIRQTVEFKGYGRREAFQVETIVDELCNNAIEHGYDGGSLGIELALAIGRDRIEINVSNGTHYSKYGENGSRDIINVMEKYIENPSHTIDESRGRGLALVKMLSNEFEIDSSEYGTCVHVIKYKGAH